MAYISNIQRFSVHDGPGIRTVVFLLGCPLRCKWCQNPETINAKPGLMMNHQLCSGCNACVNICPGKAISRDASGRIITDRENCCGCWKCNNECYFQARQLTGKLYTVEDVFKEIRKDEVVYKNTGGGVTLSGGEPTLHTDFCFQLLEKCRNYGIHTAIETCGYTDWENFEKLLKVTDLFLYDLKLLDGIKHKNWTGVDNAKILGNLKSLVKASADIIIRVPLIPGVNDDVEEFAGMMSFVKGLGSISSIHIMPFHQIGSSKYEMIGADYQLKDLKEQNKENVDKCAKIAADMGFRVSIGGAGFKEEAKAVLKSTPTRSSFLYKV